MNKHKLFVTALVLSVLLTLTAGMALAQGPGGGQPIKSVVAGTGLAGGGNSGDVSLAIADTYRLPQACATWQIAKWNGSAWTCAIDGLTLPFAKSVNGDGKALEITNTGTGGAGQFAINNPVNSSFAFSASTRGTGGAAAFDVNNTANTIQAVYIKSNGSGDGLGVQMDGLGFGGRFGIYNSANSNRALGSYTVGTGPAGWFSINNPASTSPALHAGTNGVGPAIEAGGGGPALVATTSGTGWTGSFTTSSGKGVYISVPAGNEGLNVASGTKNAVVATANGARLLYTEESSQVWFTDYGFGQLQNGRVTIAIDPVFAGTVNLDQPYHVFVQAYGDAELYVSNRTRTGFQVQARDGEANVEFSYRLVALRLGFEDKRLELAAWADDDPNLYPGK